MSNIHTIHDLNKRESQLRNDSSNQIGVGFPGIQQPNNNSQEQDNSFYKCLNLFFPFFRIRSFTFIISIINIIVYIIEEIVYSTQNNLRVCVFYNMGAKFTPSIRYKYHLFRLIMPIILHASPWHLISNTLTLYFFGFMTEHFLGTKKMIIFYLFCGIFSTNFSALCLSDRLSVGASGAIFGLLGFFIVYVIINRQILMQNPNFKIMMIFFIIMFSYSIIFSIFQENLTEDIYGHIGNINNY